MDEPRRRSGTKKKGGDEILAASAPSSKIKAEDVGSPVVLSGSNRSRRSNKQEKESGTSSGSRHEKDSHQVLSTGKRIERVGDVDFHGASKHKRTHESSKPAIAVHREKHGNDPKKERTSRKTAHSSYEPATNAKDRKEKLVTGSIPLADEPDPSEESDENSDGQVNQKIGGHNQDQVTYSDRAYDDRPVKSAPEISNLHETIPQNIPGSKRLQRLVELSVEFEQDQVSRMCTGSDAWISRAFDIISEDFIAQAERLATSRLKRLPPPCAAAATDTAASTAAEAVAAAAHPVNARRAAQELSLRRALERLQEEQREWERLAAASPAAGAGALLPTQARGGAGALWEGLTEADRTMLLRAGDAAGGDVAEGLVWARGLVEGGLGLARARLGGLEAAGERAAAAHRRLVGGLRRRAFAPLAAASGDPRAILRAIVAAGPASA